MDHVIACYGIVIGALVAYGLTLSRARNNLRKHLGREADQDAG